jgi:putative addiction module component (TIGR02574 family)
MKMSVPDMVAQAKQLPAEEQAALLAALHDLVAPPKPDWEAAWAQECQDRLAAYRRGDMDALDSDEAMAALRRKHGVK